MEARATRFSSATVFVVVATAAFPAGAQEFFEEITGNPLGSATDWTNYIRLDDLDGDGDLDVVVPNCGGFFGPPTPEPFRLYVNDGKAGFLEAPERLGGPFSASIRVVDLGDVDGDGDRDLFAPSAGGGNDRLFINDGTGHFVDEAVARLPAASHSAGVRFADVDGDGDLDLLVGQGYAHPDPVPVRLFRNDGKGYFVDGSSALPQLGPNDIDDVDVFDADGDFDLDVLLSSHGGKPALWLNDGLGTYVDATERLGIAGGGYKYGPTTCDVDGDGDRDVWIDNTGPGYTEALLINDGTGNFVEETLARVVGNPGADDNGVVCADVDLDGDFDAIVVSLSASERVLLNDGSGHFTNVGGFPAIQDSSLWMDLGDLDGDGRLDAVTAQGESGDLRNRAYLASGDNPIDTRAPVLALGPMPAALADGESVGLRFRVTDRVQVDSGPRVRAELRVVADGMARPPVPAQFVGGDLFQATLVGSSAATLEVRACAVDMQGNEGCSAPKWMGEPVTSSSASGGEGGASVAEAATGAGGGEAFATPTAGGCACAIGSPPTPMPPIRALLVLVGMLAAVRRKRRP